MAGTIPQEPQEHHDETYDMSGWSELGKCLQGFSCELPVSEYVNR